jgi:hypothetical protein
MIISLSGKKRSGKGTIADHLKRHGWLEVSWAEPLKEIIGRGLFGLNDAQMYGDTESKEAIIPEWNMSAREILQKVGTDMFRQHICDDFWVRIGIRNIKKCLAQNPNINIVISDTRFPNEANAIKELGGYLIWVHRDNNPHANDRHPSETALDDYRGWNKIVSADDGDLESLKAQTDWFISRMNKLYDVTGVY